MDVNNAEVNAGPIASVPFFIDSEPVAFRPIHTNDFHIIKELHELFFPIKYDDAFYEKICNGTAVVGKGRLFSSLAVLNGEVIGFVLGQFIDYPSRCEDKGMFSADREPKTVFYILTLGLIEKYRRTGLGSKLIQQCEDFANLDWECGAVSDTDYNSSLKKVDVSEYTLYHLQTGVSARDHLQHERHPIL